MIRVNKAGTMLEGNGFDLLTEFMSIVEALVATLSGELDETSEADIRAVLKQTFEVALKNTERRETV